MGNLIISRLWRQMEQNPEPLTPTLSLWEREGKAQTAHQTAPSRCGLDRLQGRPGGAEALASMVARRTVGRLHLHRDTQRV